MHVVITGGAGFLGQRLAHRLSKRGSVMRNGKEHPIDRITLSDLHVSSTPPEWMSGNIDQVACPITDRKAVTELLSGPAEVSVFHLASIVSAQAETDLDLALSVNVQGALNILDSLRARPGQPRFIATSSLAVFGGTLPEVCDDRTKQTPESTYGMTKAILELLINDYTRRGHIDGRIARLPTVIIRPGSANAAASSVASAIFREPLNGRAYDIPVPLDTALAITDIDSVVDGLITLHDAAPNGLGLDRAVNFPSQTYTVGEMLASLHRVAGERDLAPTRIAPDPHTETIVRSWPTVVDASRAQRLGVPPSKDIDQVVADYIQALETAPTS